MNKFLTVACLFCVVSTSAAAFGQASYSLSMSDDHFGIGNPPFESDFAYYDYGLMAYGRAWDGGNITMYTVSQNSYIRCDPGPCDEEIDVVAITDHVGSGDGCSSIHYFDENNVYITLLEQCGPGLRAFELPMQVDFEYRFATNAQANSTAGETTEYRSELIFLLPPDYALPPGSHLIFFDGFESGDVSAWTGE